MAITINHPSTHVFVDRCWGHQEGNKGKRIKLGADRYWGGVGENNFLLLSGKRNSRSLSGQIKPGPPQPRSQQAITLLLTTKPLFSQGQPPIGLNCVPTQSMSALPTEPYLKVGSLFSVYLMPSEHC